MSPAIWGRFTDCVANRKFSCMSVACSGLKTGWSWWRRDLTIAKWRKTPGRCLFPFHNVYSPYRTTETVVQLDLEFYRSIFLQSQVCQPPNHHLLVDRSVLQTGNRVGTDFSSLSSFIVMVPALKPFTGSREMILIIVLQKSPTFWLLTDALKMLTFSDFEL